MSEVQLLLLEPAKVILTQIGRFVINALLVVIILFIGWLISKVIRTVVTKLLRKIDFIWDRIELDSLLEKGGIKYSLSELVGVICYWLALLVTFIVAINAIGLTIAAELLQKVVLYIPNVILGIFILILGMFVATILKSVVQTAANNAGLAQAKIFSKVVEVVVIAFSVFITLEQLKIGIRITELTVGIILGSVGLGLALAFGLGCRDIAGKFTAEFIEKLKK